MMLLTLCMVAIPAPAQNVQTVQPQVLKGHVPKITRRLRALHRLEAGTQLNLAIGLPLRNRPQLTNLLQQLYDPASPSFRHFLKSDEFATAFGPSESDYQAVIDFAKSHGLKVKKTTPTARCWM